MQPPARNAPQKSAAVQTRKVRRFKNGHLVVFFRKISLSAGVSTIGEESNAIGLITNGITDKQRKSMTSVVFDHI